MKATLDEQFSRRSAARWFARLRSGAASDSTDVAFRRWLERDPNHERALERTELLWSLLGDLHQDGEVRGWIDNARARPSDDPGNIPGMWRHLAMRRWYAMATVAICIVAGLVYFAMVSRVPRAPVVTAKSIEGHYQSAVGERRRIALTDGSVIELNTATDVRVRYTDRSRQVFLGSGEALFVVHHDISRPFEVIAGETRTRDVGTTFNILALNGRTQVAVLEGRVDVTGEPEHAPSTDSPQHSGVPGITLGAGESTTYAGDTGFTLPKSADIERIQSWRSGRVEFHDVALSDALVDFNRYTKTSIVLGDSSLAAIHLSGVFRAGDVKALTQALNHAFGIRATEQPALHTVVLQPKRPS